MSAEKYKFKISSTRYFNGDDYENRERYNLETTENGQMQMAWKNPSVRFRSKIFESDSSNFYVRRGAYYSVSLTVLKLSFSM